MSEITGVHPYADKFPMLPQAELEELAQSIRESGLRQPIVVTVDGLILDGRNRFQACRMAGIEPETVVYEGSDLAEYVLDANITRRNMTTGQRAMATALVLEADGRRVNGRWKRDSINLTGIRNPARWRQALSNAGAVLDHRHELADLVVKGELALDAAFREAEKARQRNTETSQPNDDNHQIDVQRTIKDALDSTRHHRSNTLSATLETIISYVQAPDSPDEGAQEALTHAYPLGDGRDMTLAYWTVSDFLASLAVRYRNAVAAMEAAKQYDEQVSALAQLMRARGATTLGDLVGGDSNANA